MAWVTAMGNLYMCFGCFVRPLQPCAAQIEKAVPLGDRLAMAVSCIACTCLHDTCKKPLHKEFMCRCTAKPCSPVRGRNTIQYWHRCGATLALHRAE